jgi:hypothetical protein
MWHGERQRDVLRYLGLHVGPYELPIVQFEPGIVPFAKIVERSDALSAVHKTKSEAATLSVLEPAAPHHQGQINDERVLDQRVCAASS